MTSETARTIGNIRRGPAQVNGRPVEGPFSDPSRPHRLAEKGKLKAEDRDAIIGRLSTGTDVDALADVDDIVEAIIEDAGVKHDLFARLDAVTRPDVILASNTSSISITVLGAATTRPDKSSGCTS